MYSKFFTDLATINNAAKFKGGGNSRLLYQLKTWAITWAALNGHLERATEQLQIMTCYRCNGTGMFWGEECWRCDNGAYRKHHLTLFIFTSGFGLHIPSNLIPYYMPPSQRTWVNLDRYDNNAFRMPFSETGLLISVVRLAWFLRRQVGTTEIMTHVVSSAINRWINRTIKTPLRRRWWGVKYGVRRIAMRVRRILSIPDSEDEIPF